MDVHGSKMRRPAVSLATEVKHRVLDQLVRGNTGVSTDDLGQRKRTADSQLLLCSSVYMLGRVKAGESILSNHLVCLCVRYLEELSFDCLMLLTASMSLTLRLKMTKALGPLSNLQGWGGEKEGGYLHY